MDINPREDDPDLNTATEDDISVDLADPLETQALIRFENIFGVGAGQIPTEGAIVSATITLWTNGATGGDISFHRMLVDWDNNSTWNTFGSDGVTQDDIESVSTETAILSEPGDDQFHTIDVTDDVQRWLEGAPNFGWVAINDSTDGWDFDSSEVNNVAQRPLLTVEFAARKAVRATGVTLDQTAWDTDGNAGSVVTPAVSAVTTTPPFPTNATVIDVFGAAVDSFVEVAENEPILYFDLDLSSRMPGETVSLDPNFEGFTAAIGPNLAPIDVSTFMTGTLTITALGDANGDLALTNADITPFVQALTDPAGYAAMFPTIDVDSVLDFNGDDRFTNADIVGFVDALTT